MGQVTALRQPPNIGGVPAAEVFDRHHADVYRYLARRVPADIADDLASETFVQAVTRAYTFDPERGVLRGWIFGIASNLLSRHHREEVRAYRAWARTGVDPLTTYLATTPGGLFAVLATATDSAMASVNAAESERKAPTSICWRWSWSLLRGPRSSV